MRNSHTLEQVICNAIEVHALSAELYSALVKRTEDPRVRMLLEDMTRHETRMTTVLRQFIGRVEPRILKTYLKHTLEKEPKAFIASLAPEGDNLSIADIGSLGQAIHQYLTDLFEHAHRGCAAGGSKELLAHLLQLELSERRTFARAVLSTREL